MLDTMFVIGKGTIKNVYCSYLLQNGNVIEYWVK